MDEKLSYWCSVVFSAIALILIVVNISLATGNHSLQTDIAARQATINGGQQLSQLNQSLVQALAEGAVKGNNASFKELLSSQGITLKPQETAKAAEAADKTTSPKK